MSSTGVDQERRKFITATTTALGGLGAVCVVWPFLNSWAPSVRTKALGAPVEVDISKLEVGQKLTVAWRGKPIFIVRRSLSSLDTLKLVQTQLRDPFSKESLQPSYATNEYRSIEKEFLVLEAVCTHLGCVPLLKTEVGSVEPSWQGGFFCPCHGSKYDIAGRVYKGVPAPLNLAVPPYRFLSKTVVRIGEDSVGAGA